MIMSFLHLIDFSIVFPIDFLTDFLIDLSFY